MKKPPAQHNAATKPALRGPARSSQPPNTAADRPSITMPMVKMINRLVTCQSQLVVKRSPITDGLGQATDLSMPIARDSGSQNTLSP